MNWLNEILHNHANWAHRWNKKNPNTYIYGSGKVTETVEAKAQIKEKLLNLIEEARNKSLPLGFLTDEIKKL